MTIGVGANVALFDQMTAAALPAGWATTGAVSTPRAQYGVMGYRYRARLTDAVGTPATMVKSVTFGTLPQVVEWDVGKCLATLRLSVLDASNAELAYIQVNDDYDAETGMCTVTAGTNGTATTQSGAFSVNWCRTFMRLTASSVLFSAGGDGIISYPTLGTALAYTGTPAKLKIATPGTGTGDADWQALYVYTPKALTVGDSLCWGHTADTGNNAEWQWDNEYNHQIADRIQPTYWVTNHGYGGRSTAQLLAEVANDLALGPECIIIAIGTAAIIAGESSATMISNVGAYIATVTAAGVKVVLCECCPSSTWDGAKNTIKSAYNAWVDTQGSANVTVVATHSHVADGASLLSTYNHDNIHMNRKGTRAAGRMMAPAVSTFLGYAQSVVTGADITNNTIINDYADTNFSTTWPWADIGNVGGSSSARMLFGADLTAASPVIPSDAVIQAADIDLLDIYEDGTDTHTLSARKILRAWVQATSTWNIWDTGHSWATAGAGGTGDIAAATTGTGEVATIRDDTPYRAIHVLGSGLATDVSDSLVGGRVDWRLSSDQEYVGTGAHYIQVASNQATRLEQQPRLVVSWSPYVAPVVDDIAPLIAAGII